MWLWIVICVFIKDGKADVYHLECGFNICSVWMLDSWKLCHWGGDVDKPSTFNSHVESKAHQPHPLVLPRDSSLCCPVTLKPFKAAPSFWHGPRTHHTTRIQVIWAPYWDVRCQLFVGAAVWASVDILPFNLSLLEICVFPGGQRPATFLRDNNVMFDGLLKTASSDNKIRWLWCHWLSEGIWRLVWVVLKRKAHISATCTIIACLPSVLSGYWFFFFNDPQIMNS